MAKKRFTFADAKEKIKDLEAELTEAREDIKGLLEDIALDTSDNIFDSGELKVIKFLKVWAAIGPILGLIIGAALL